MKTANETCNCALFSEQLQAYIDNELDETDAERFKAHAAHCGNCGNILRDMCRVMDCLGGMNQESVSPEFDFRLKSTIRLEHKKLQQPTYRIGLFFRETFRPMAAAAVIILTASFAGYTFLGEPSSPPAAVDGNGKQTQVVEAADGDEITEYVIDSIDSEEAENGVFLESAPPRQQAQSSEITLISF